MAQADLYFVSSVSGNCVDPGNAVGAPNGVWTGNTGNTDWTHRWSLDSAGDVNDTPTGQQTLRILARRSDSGSGSPEINTVELFQNGVSVGTVFTGNFTPPSTGSSELVINFDGSLLDGLENVDCELVTIGHGGGPNARSIQIDATTWESNYEANGGTPVEEAFVVGTAVSISKELYYYGGTQVAIVAGQASEEGILLDPEVSQLTFDVEWRVQGETELTGSATGIEGDSHLIESLTSDTTYEWRVRAVLDGQTSDWTAWESASTQAGVDVALSSANANALGRTLDEQGGLSVGFSSGVASGSSQELGVSVGSSTTLTDSTAAASGRILSVASGNSSSLDTATATSDGKDILLSVGSSVEINAGIASSISREITAQAGTTIPVDVSFISGVANSVGRTLSVDVGGFTFDFQCREQSTQTLVVDTSGITELFYVVSDLDPSTTYEWRVRAVEGAETSDWTAWESVTTIQSISVSLNTGIAGALSRSIAPNTGVGVSFSPSVASSVGKDIVPEAITTPEVSEAIVVGQANGSGRTLSPTVTDLTFNIEWRVLGSETLAGSATGVTEVTYLVENLDHSTGYEWRVQAETSEGTSHWTAWQEVLTAPSYQMDAELSVHIYPDATFFYDDSGQDGVFVPLSPATAAALSRTLSEQIGSSQGLSTGQANGVGRELVAQVGETIPVSVSINLNTASSIGRTLSVASGSVLSIDKNTSTTEGNTLVPNAGNSTSLVQGEAESVGVVLGLSQGVSQTLSANVGQGVGQDLIAVVGQSVPVSVPFTVGSANAQPTTLSVQVGETISLSAGEASGQGNSLTAQTGAEEGLVKAEATSTGHTLDTQIGESVSFVSGEASGTGREIFGLAGESIPVSTPISRGSSDGVSKELQIITGNVTSLERNAAVSVGTFLNVSAGLSVSTESNTATTSGKEISPETGVEEYFDLGTASGLGRTLEVVATESGTISKGQTTTEGKTLSVEVGYVETLETGTARGVEVSLVPNTGLSVDDVEPGIAAGSGKEYQTNTGVTITVVNGEATSESRDVGWNVGESIFIESGLSNGVGKELNVFTGFILGEIRNPATMSKTVRLTNSTRTILLRTKRG